MPQAACGSSASRFRRKPRAWRCRTSAPANPSSAATSSRRGAGRGYDIRPHVLGLASGEGAKAADVRHDWGQTLTELVGEHFISPLEQWATAHGTKLRAQTYGTPPASTSSATLVDLPEGEGAAW